MKNYKSLRKLRVGVNWYPGVNWSTTAMGTAWRHIMAQTLNLHITEVKILKDCCNLSHTFAHFHLTNKEVEVTTEII